MSKKESSKTTNHLIYMVLFALIVCTFAVAVILLIDYTSEAKSTQVEVTQLPPQEVVVPEIIPNTQVRLVGVGDNLIHEALYSQASRRAGGIGYDFELAYQNVQDIIASADIASMNQETLMADKYPPSAYPMFNSPSELGHHMTDIGFDVINQANNHVFDKGEQGVLETIDFWKTQDIAFTGVYENEADYEQIRTITQHDIIFSFIGMTQFTNGLSLPQNSDVILMQTEDEQRIQERIEQAKTISDIVVVNVHWGIEYTHEANEIQRNLAKKMVEWGADIILGHHPHVLQPIEYIEREDGTKGVVVYSLGNFISAQNKAPRMLGGMIDIMIEKNHEEDKTYISSVKFLPIITHYGAGFSNVTNYLLEDYTPQLASTHGVRIEDSTFTYEYLQETVASVIDEQFL